jgi:hypothetical protein
MRVRLVPTQLQFTITRRRTGRVEGGKVEVRGETDRYRRSESSGVGHRETEVMIEGMRMRM